MQATGCCALSVTNDKNSRTALENPGKERMNMMFFNDYHSTFFACRLEPSSFLWRLKLAIWCFEFSWKLSVFSTWSIWFVSFCLCLARWGCQRENPQKEVAADRPSNDNRANTARCCQHCRIVFCIISSSSALSYSFFSRLALSSVLSPPLMHCQCYHLMHSFLLLHRLVNCLLLL